MARQLTRAARTKRDAGSEEVSDEVPCERHLAAKRDTKLTRVERGPDARIIRGGSWRADNTSKAYRAWGGPTNHDAYLGFRCAL
jgi:formylglycine-generating enzyme required for sulfatase activity